MSGEVLEGIPEEMSETIPEEFLKLLVRFRKESLEVPEEISDGILEEFF